MLRVRSGLRGSIPLGCKIQELDTCFVLKISEHESDGVAEFGFYFRLNIPGVLMKGCDLISNGRWRSVRIDGRAGVDNKVGSELLISAG